MRVSVCLNWERLSKKWVANQLISAPFSPLDNDYLKQKFNALHPFDGSSAGGLVAKLTAVQTIKIKKLK